MPSQTRALTSAVAAGDAEAFTRFFRARFDWMLAEARRATGRDEAFCLDVVQDAMLRVIRSLPALEGEDDLRRWLRAVVCCCARDRLRSEARRRRRELAAPPGPQRGDAAALKARLRWLEDELRALDDGSLQLLLMRHRFGWTLREIADALGRSTGAVDGSLRRLTRHLRRRAREEFDDE